MVKHSVFFVALNSIFMRHMGIFFALIGLISFLTLTAAASVTVTLQPINGEGEDRTLKHGSRVSHYNTMPQEGQIFVQGMKSSTAASSRFLNKDIRVSGAGNCLSCRKKTIRKHAMIATVNYMRLHRQQIQLHQKMNEGALTDPAEVTSHAALTPATEKTTTHAADIPAQPAVGAQINNEFPTVGHHIAGGVRHHPAGRDLLKKETSSPLPIKVSLSAATTAASSHMPLNAAAGTDLGVRAQLSSDHGHIRSYDVPLNDVVASRRSAAALEIAVAYAHKIGNGNDSAVSTAGDHAAEASAWNDDLPTIAAAKLSVTYRRRAHGLMEVREGETRAASPSSSSLDYERARAFHVDYSRPRTHPPRNN